MIIPWTYRAASLARLHCEGFPSGEKRKAEQQRLAAAAIKITQERGAAWVIAPVVRAAIAGHDTTVDLDLAKYTLPEDLSTKKQEALQ